MLKFSLTECRKCISARMACNQNYVTCRGWSMVKLYGSDMISSFGTHADHILTTYQHLLPTMLKKENLNDNEFRYMLEEEVDAVISDRYARGFNDLIDVFGPKNVYEGWARMGYRYTGLPFVKTADNGGMITNFCICTEPDDFCVFFKRK